MAATHTHKRDCKVCDSKTVQLVTCDDMDSPIWKCLCCYTVTPRTVRKPSAARIAKMAAIDALFESLEQEVKQMDNPLVQPTVHMNGTNAADLLEGYCVARQAVTAAMQKLAEYASPNGRDYYPKNNFPAAQEQYEAWQESLRKVAKDLEGLCDYTSDFVK